MARWTIVVAVVVAAGPVLSVTAQQVRPFTVAAVTYGGDASLLVPVARFTGSSWVQTWPESDDTNVPVPALSDVPSEWLAGPVPRTWTAWSAAGRRTSVRVIRTARSGACEGPIALRIDRQLTAPAVTDHATLAIDGPEAVGLFAVLTDATPEWRQIESVAAAEFGRLERGFVDRFQDEVQLKKTMLEEAIRPGTRPVLEAAFRARPPSDPTMVRFEATKRTRAFPEYGISVAGWAVRQSDGRWRTIEALARLLTSDSGPVPNHDPLGWFRLGGRTFWLVASNGYEGGSVIIYDVSTTRVTPILETYLGGC